MIEYRDIETIHKAAAWRSGLIGNFRFDLGQLYQVAGSRSNHYTNARQIAMPIATLALIMLSGLVHAAAFHARRHERP